MTIPRDRIGFVDNGKLVGVLRGLAVHDVGGAISQERVEEVMAKIAADLDDQPSFSRAPIKTGRLFGEPTFRPTQRQRDIVDGKIDLVRFYGGCRSRA